MAAPNHADQPPASAPASPTAGNDDHHGAAPDQDPTRLLTELFAGATLGRVPKDATDDHVEQPPAAAAAEAGASSASPAVPATARPLATPPPELRHFFDPPPAPAADVPGVQCRRPDVFDELRAKLRPAYDRAAINATAMPAGRRPDAIEEIIMARLADGGKLGSNAYDRADLRVAPTARELAAAGSAGYSPSDLIWICAHQGIPDGEPEPAGAHAERAARRREARRLSKLPTDYLRAGQESRDRRRRRGMMRRCVRTLLSLQEDRRNERVLSAMMARLATMGSSAAGDGGATVAAAPGDASAAAEHAELAGLIEKMELSFKD